MNREIKFRAWDEVNKEMVYPKIIKESFSSLSSGDILNRYENIMQFTGLKDRNGTEIYEGDIVRAFGQDNTYLQVIEFHNTKQSCGRGWIGINKVKEENKIKKEPSQKIDRFSYFSWPFECVVIGNIYQNPELLNNK